MHPRFEIYETPISSGYFRKGQYASDTRTVDWDDCVVDLTWGYDVSLVSLRESSKHKCSFIKKVSKIKTSLA
jgi:hypothetical protein